MGKGGSRGGGGSAASAETSLTKEQAAISRRLFEETTGLRRGLLGAAEKRLGLPSSQVGQVQVGTQRVQVGVSPSFETEFEDGISRRREIPGGGEPIFEEQPIFETRELPSADLALFGPRSPEREALELGFNQAREDIISGIPRGGVQQQALANLPIQRAQARAGQEAAGIERALAIAQPAAFETPALTLSGLGGAAAQFGSQAQRQAQLQASQGQAKGSTAGSALNAAATVAAAVIGK